MLTFKQYTKAIDVWSVGCILAEMLSGKPLFPGRDYHHQLSLILDVLGVYTASVATPHLLMIPAGTPTIDEFYAISTRRSRDYLRALPFRRKKPFSQLFPQASEAAVDFLTKTLTFDPKKRMTVEEALAHPYLEAYVRVHAPSTLLPSNQRSRYSHWQHDPNDEPTCASLPPEFFEFDLQKDEISREQLKELLYEECVFLLCASTLRRILFAHTISTTE
jgi:mitogen-activated protein kinase 1/3